MLFYVDSRKKFEIEKRQRISFYLERWNVPYQNHHTCCVRSSSLWEAYTQTCTKWDKKFTQHPCCSMLILEKNWNREEAMHIASSRKVKRSVPQPSGLLWEALVCEMHIPKATPYGTKKLPQHVDAAPWQHAMFHEFQTSFGLTRI